MVFADGAVGGGKPPILAEVERVLRLQLLHLLPYPPQIQVSNKLQQLTSSWLCA